MPYRILQDQARYRAIIRGRIKADLGRYIQHEELLGRRGREMVSIPVPVIELPRFTFDDRQQGGVSQGEGQPGDPLAGGLEPGRRVAGDAPAQHLQEVDVSLDELADLVGEALALPHLRPRGSDRTVATRLRYRSVATTGPESLRHFRRTFHRALLRQIATGTYDPSQPVVVPERVDRRYRTWREVPRQESNAVVIYMMDVSGSMGDEQKALVRITSFWIDTWLRRHYPGLVVRYLVHDATAWEVDREAFFHTRESGGTVISSAYLLAMRIIEADYPAEAWNVYPFHFSDGDNSGEADNQACLELLRARLLPAVNQLCYGQVGSPSGSGRFLGALQAGLGPRSDLTTAELRDREAIIPAIQAFLGAGR
jgi:uncharacterized sporulation protein YeaH/YhbH (DUF444 family)